MKHNKFYLFVFVVLSFFLLTACASQSAKAGQTLKAELPVDKGYAEGKEIYFTHTEASNADAAQKLADMMQSPVMFVPSLASVPDEALANVYSFANGVKGGGSSGYQLPVFDNPPSAEGYTPLRRLNVVVWADESQARELKSASEILEAAQTGQLAIKQPGIVINMPFVVWDGGKR